jgi:hypothetical protein
VLPHRPSLAAWYWFCLPLIWSAFFVYCSSSACSTVRRISETPASWIWPDLAGALARVDPVRTASVEECARDAAKRWNHGSSIESRLV